MIIELKDRGHWIAFCNKVIQEVIDKRKAYDLEYEKQWRKRKWPYKDRPDTEFPPKSDIWSGHEYPSSDGWGTMRTAKRLKKILEDPYTNVVTLTDIEYNL